MHLNPKTEEHFKPVQAQEIERILREIKKLSPDIQALIKEGEEVIDNHFEFMEEEKRKGHYVPEDISGTNVFNLHRSIPGDVLKYLMMLYSAYGFHHVCFECEQFSSQDDEIRVRYPNAIMMRFSR